ncbi:uveal autoantigen with coiled-coil domains and ankyrin repeats isoform X6 [Spodoptera frugiperda]|uniref:Uveal autoantigen with coiled-coil domains and ankyrin repeats isoform X6 n=1 Tax=Spodoptera frugiperda TaxID=7108 RepID=A0A9R0EXN0_SPOFR|nr:uveal autoantigen with coiled-coil domains and ankyrin repeats isoform X6 [Spodoptera frugiperda]
MHHLYPLAKGDPLCPLGFHPQVRWPTRCKRCFRDYKEHGGVRKKEDDFTVSTPSLSTWNTPSSRSRDEDNGAEVEKVGRGWASSSNLSTIDTPKKDAFSTGFTRTSASWTSTPDLGANETESTNAVTVSLKLPKRRLTGPLPSIDTGQNHTTDTVTLRRPSPSPPPVPAPAQAQITISKNDSLAERVRKMQLIKSQNSFEKESSIEKERERRSLSRSKEAYHEEKPARPKEDRSSTKDDVNFMMQVKNSRNSSASSKPPVRGGPSRDRDDSDDDTSTAGTVTTETTLVDANVKEYQEQIESLKQEVDTLKKRCERVEKEKSDILLRRLANIDSVNKYTTGRSSEVLKLQQKVNELTSQNEDLKDEKKHLSLRVREIESELESRPSIEAQTRQIEQLRAKLLAAETLCEELMDENEDMKKELRDLEEEIEEMQDNFREDQADEYSSLRRELEQTIKNCRVLSFKLKKTERKADQLEQEKAEHEKKLLEIVGGQDGLQRENRIKELEQEVARSTEVALRLQRELSEANAKLAAASGTPPANLKKNQLTDGKVSRSSLTRGGSQEDPAQLLRDLQDSLEREADLREQLRNAEEEANNLRKTASRVEDDNESLLLQLKKMATKARSRKLSPTPPSNKLSVDNNEKDAKTDEEDPAELRILLELNEQETTVLRKKVEEMEQEKDSLKKQVKELTDKIANQPKNNSTVTLRRATNAKSNNLAEEKVKVLEDEIAELRKKLIEKERDCERLHAELSLSKKPKASLIKSKSLDGDQQNVDLKRQLQVIEQEANVLRAKTQSLEADNEKLQLENKKLQLLKNTKTLKSDKSVEQNAAKITQLENELKEALAKLKEFENNKDDKTEKKVRFGGEINSKKDADALKAKQEELDKLKLNFTKLEKEKAQLQVSLRVLKEEALKSFRPRVPKKPTDLTTKLQMKRMVEDLESEIGEMYVIMKNAGLSGTEINTRAQMEKDIEEIRSKLSKNDSEFTNEKNRLQTEIAKLKDLNAKLESDKTEINGKLKTLEKDNSSIAGQIKTLQEEKKGLETQVSKLNSELKNATSLQTTMSDCMKKIEELKNEIDVKDKEIDKLKKQVENVNKLEQDKQKLLKEVGDKTKKITDLEKKFKEAEDKCKRVEKQLTLRKDKVAKLEKEEDALRDTSNQKYDEAISSVEMAQMQDKLERTTKELEEKQEELTNAKRELESTEKELSVIKTEMIQLKSSISKLESEKKEHENKLQAEKKESSYWESKASELETDLQAERKKLDRMRKAHDVDIKNKEAELATLKGKLKVLEQSSGAGAKKISDLKQEYEETVKKLEHSLAVEKAEYEELTGKYEILEEEHVVTKARLTVEKEQAQGELIHAQKELASALAEIKTLQDNYDTQSSAWTKEKTELQNSISSLQDRLCGGGWEVERARLNAKLEQRERELRTVNDQRDVLEHHHDQAKKELEEARKKLEDYERVSKVQRTLTTENAELERELSSLNTRLEQADVARKNELAEMKLRYEGQMNTMRDELKSLHNQVSRFRRERDNYKQMLDAAQKTMTEMKNGDKNARTARLSISSTDEEEYRNKVATLEQQTACLEDELCEARLLASKLNTELISERSAAEVRFAEMQSRLNEYEEERLLTSGRARVAGLATRMELAWHKERDEQQRLLQETSTLARDLRQTLFEIEREREKERLDMKRRIEQLKRTTEEETEEAKKKVTELQCDLLELRDAHAKLRTANEKLRRDKERHDRDRDQNKLLVGSLKRAQQEDDRIITQLLETIDDLMKQSPDLFRNDAPVKPEKTLLTPTPPRRNRSSKSRSRSATPENGVNTVDAATTAARLRRLTDELRASRIAERQRRHQATARRAMSTEPRDTLSVTPASRTPSRAPSLKKRSISLEQTTKDQSLIWKSVDESSVSSMQSLDGDADNRLFTMQRDASLDSRLSGGSAQSEVLPSEKKKKKSIFGKLKKLTKSRSIDDQVDSTEHVEFRPIGTVSQQGSDSDMSAAGSKRDLRGRLSDMFSRKGAMSRTNSKELSPERPASAMGSMTSSSRPPLRNASSSTLARASPAKPNEVPRPASATPAAKRKGK